MLIRVIDETEKILELVKNFVSQFSWINEETHKMENFKFSATTDNVGTFSVLPFEDGNVANIFIHDKKRTINIIIKIKEDTLGCRTFESYTIHMSDTKDYFYGTKSIIEDDNTPVSKKLKPLFDDLKEAMSYKPQEIE